MIKTYKIISGSDNEFALKADSLRTYEELHKLKMRCTAVKSSERLEIAKEFKWKVDDYEPDLGYSEYLAQVALLLFQHNPNHTLSAGDEFAPGEINKAERFFFQRANGISPEQLKS